MENKELILGLDVSTTTIGVCLMLVEGDEKKLLLTSSVSPKINKNIKGIESLFLKKQIFENEFLLKYIDYGINKVIIEEPLLGSNNIHTVATLLRFNGMISETIYRTLGIVPQFISSYDSRKYAFPQLMCVRTFNKKGEKIPEQKLKKAKPVLFGAFPSDIDKKIIINELVLELYPNMDRIYNKKNEIAKENYDASDAVCCVLGWLNKEKIENI